MKKHTEPQQSQASNEGASQQAEPYSRFNEPVADKPGLGQRVTITDPSLLTKPIDEVKFTPPPVEKEIHPLGGGQQSAKPDTSKQPGQENKEKINSFQDPNLKDLPPAQKELSAGQLSNFLLNRYEGLHGWANKKIQISEKKVLKLVREGKLDLRALVPYEFDQFMTIGELIKEFNKEYSQLFFVDPAWRAEIEPPLTRIFAKRGIGLSDEAFVGFMLMTDLGVKTSLAFEAFSKTSSVLQFAVEQTARMKGVVAMNPKPRPDTNEPPMGPAPVVNMPQPDHGGPSGGNIASMPVMITASMRQQLHDLGYNQADINTMAPETAHDIINSMQAKQVSVPVQDHFMGNAGTVVAEHAMSGAVESRQLPKWGEAADKLNKRGGRPPGSKNKKNIKPGPKKIAKKKRA